MAIRETISGVFRSVFEDHLDSQAPELSDDVVLLESGLDSLGFAILVTRLEDELGYDPFAIASTPYYPRTFGDFVNFYERNQP